MNDSTYTLTRPDTARTLTLRFGYLFGVAIAVLVVDQIVKVIVTEKLSDGRFIDLLGGLIRLDYTRNSGAAFGMYQGGGVVFAVIAVGVSAAIVLSYRRLARSPALVRISLGLIMGGALGNLLDRVRLGYVIDFIDLRWWPVFNIADSAIVLGVGLLILHSLLRPSPAVSA